MSVRIIDKAAEKVVGVRVVGPYPQTIPQGSQQLLAWRQQLLRAVRQMAGVVLGRSGGSGAGKAARRRGDERGG